MCANSALPQTPTMAQRISCLKCLAAIDQDAPVPDPLRACAQCGIPVGTPFVTLSADYFMGHLAQLIFKEAGRANLARSCVKVTLPGVPLAIVKAWVKDVAAMSLRNKCRWDREAEDVQWQRLPGKNSWLLTTWVAAEAVCNFHDYITPPDLQKCWLNCRQLQGGDLVFVIGPITITHQSQATPSQSTNDVLHVTFSTACVSYTEAGFFRMAGTQPAETDDKHANKSRWPHLPFYSDYNQYMCFKSARAVITAASKSAPEQQKLLKGTKVLLRALARKWGAVGPPKLVRKRWPRGDDFWPGRIRPYQHPKLSAATAGFKTLMEHKAVNQKMQQQRERREKVVEERRAKIARQEYAESKALSLSLLNRPGITEQHREQYLARDPRFNGEHARLGYEGVGTPPEKRALAMASSTRLRDLGFRPFMKPPSFPHLNPADCLSGQSSSSSGGESDSDYETEGEESSDEQEDEYSDGEDSAD